MTSKSCIHAYSGISIAETVGIIRPCCKYEPSDDFLTIFDVNSLNDIHSTEYYKHLQTQLDNGVFPIGCYKCKIDEDAGIKSSRQNTFEHAFDNGNLFIKNTIQDLEIGLDFTCNMMCRMCNPNASSKWGQATSVLNEFDKDEIPLGMIDSTKEYKLYQTRFIEVFKNTDLSKAINLRLEGGEPFYSKNLEWFIDKLDREIENKKYVYINIFTNGSIFPSPVLIEKLKKFNVVITFSFDAVGELAETIRWGVKWSVIEAVVKKWRAVADENHNVILATCSTISLLNVNCIEPLVEFCNRYNIRMNFNHLTTPEYLSIYQLPADVRSRWSFGNSDFDALLLANITVPTHYDHFIKSVEILDQYQKKSFALNNSEIYNLIVELNEFERQRRVTDGQ